MCRRWPRLRQRPRRAPFSQRRQKNRTALGVARVNLKAQVAKYTKLLSELNAAQRAKLLLIAQTKIKSVAQAPITKSQRKAQVKFATASPAPAPSGRAGIAVAFALAQIGKPYVFAAAGPGAFDCSGLTMAAWGKAGVSLPHFAAAQFGMGHAVSKSQLEPGDLVFFYPVSRTLPCTSVTAWSCTRRTPAT